MDHQEIHRELQFLMPQLRDSSDPASVLLKRASSCGWTPAVLERIGQTLNQLKTLSIMDKAASVEARGQTFPILDVPSMLGKYVTWQPKVAFDESLSSAWFDDVGVDGIKLASSDVQSCDRAPNWVGQLAGTDYDPNAEVVAEKKAAEAAPTYWQIRPELRNIAREVSTLESMRHEAGSVVFDCIEKIARLVAYGDTTRALEIAQDIRMGLRDANTPVAIQFLQHCKQARAVGDIGDETDRRVLGRDRYGVVPLAKQACEHLQLQQVYKTMQESLRQQFHQKVAAFDPDDFDTGVTDAINSDIEELDAASADATGDPFDPATRHDPFAEYERGKQKKNEERERQELPDAETTVPTPAGSPAGVSPNLLKRLTDGASAATGKIEKGTSQALRDILLQHNSKLEQVNGIQGAVKSDLRARTTLARLLLNDPILAKVPAPKVISLFNTIRAANPDVAADPNLLTMALRDAVAQGGMQLHQYQQLLSATKDAPKSPKKTPLGDAGVTVNLLGI